MIAQLMHIDAAADDPVVLWGSPRRRRRRAAARSPALETHGRDLGYEIDAWIDGALRLAGVELSASMTSSS
jgi:hypothetical protein